jgi:hypothetical protein
MKRPLLIAALLAVAPIATGGAAQAQVSQMFNIKTPAAGTVDFRGEGTANFNQSLGTNNNFNVGSSTNLGVSASASSTSDYSSAGNALLKLDGSSRLQQTIGTATSAFNSSTTAEASARSADITASTHAETQMYGSEINSEWAEGWEGSDGYEYVSQEQIDLATSASAEGDYGYMEGISGKGGAAFVEGFYEKSADQVDVDSNVTEKGGYEFSETFTQKATDTFNEEYSDVYSDRYETAYETATKSASSQDVNTDDSGIISGDFITKTSGSSNSSIGGLASSFNQSATDSARTAVGGSRDSFSSFSASEQEEFGLNEDLNVGYSRTDGDGTTTTTAFTMGMDTSSSGADLSESEMSQYSEFVENYESSENSYKTQYDAAYQESYAESYSAANSALERTTESSVTVKGIGVIADVNADASSTFEASSQLTVATGDSPAIARNGNGNGNASANAFLSTSSSANQTSNDTAQAFMQAFSTNTAD